MNKQFKLPRKVKKKLKKTLWHYPQDEKGNSLMASPHREKDDYVAFKKGIVRDIMSSSNKAERKNKIEKLNAEIYVSDEELEQFVNDIFAIEFRIPSFQTLLKAKKHPLAKVAYFNFVNAYFLHKKADDSGNTCCMAVDYARDLLRKKRK